MAETLIELLVREKLVSPDQAESAKEIAEARHTSPVQHLLSTGQLDENSLLKFFTKKFSIPSVRLTNIGSAALKKVPLEMVVKFRCIPYQIESDNSIRVAVADPMDLPNIEKMKAFVTQKMIPVFTTFSSHEMALRKISEKLSSRGGVVPAAGVATFAAAAVTEIVELVESAEPLAPAPARPRPVAVPPPPEPEPKARFRPTHAAPPVKRFSAQQPIIGILNDILSDSIAKGASDVHVEPQPNQIRVRLRLEGSLFDVAVIPVELKDQIVTRAKVMSNLDISEHRMPQDGRAKLKVGTEEISFRVNIMPSLYGESLVFRVLRQGNVHLDVSQLGFSPDQLKLFRKGINAPNGLVLLTGPTGSGKTTTLYSALAELNSASVKITTVEDPVEYNLEGITQVPINKDTGLTFAEVLRGILRQDPDIILVGEIRDQETAAVAVQAALTGHLVFSSLHTNDAPSAVLRLLNMGVEPFVVLASISMVVAERLLRKICTGCAKPTTVTERQLEMLGADRRFLERAKFMHGEGCERCLGGGYRVRVAIFEVLDLSDSLKEIILKGENQISVRRRAVADGMKTLRQSALQLVAAGTTTLEEALASTLEK